MNDLMHTFATVVESGSLNLAAKKLNLSQPAVSRKVARLEQQLGLPLFERKGKRLFLNQAGEVVYDYARKFRHLEHELNFALAKWKGGPPKSLTIGASLTTLQSTLPDLIHLLSIDNPEADIKAITGKTHEIVELVKTKKIDIGLVASKVNHPSVRCVPLFEDVLSLVVPKHHAFAEQQEIPISKLKNLPMILFSRGTWYRILTDELFQKYNVQPDIKMEIDSFEAILRLISTINAASLLPKSYLRPTLLKNNQLTHVQIREINETIRTTSLIYTDWSDLNPLAQTLIEKALDKYNPERK